MPAVPSELPGRYKPPQLQAPPTAPVADISWWEAARRTLGVAWMRVPLTLQIIFSSEPRRPWAVRRRV